MVTSKLHLYFFIHIITLCCGKALAIEHEATITRFENVNMANIAKDFRIDTLYDRGLTGLGVNVAVIDGSENNRGRQHPDISYSTLSEDTNGRGLSPHALGMLGIVAGSGNYCPQAKGIAPKANLFFFDVEANMDDNNDADTFENLNTIKIRLNQDLTISFPHKDKAINHNLKKGDILTFQGELPPAITSFSSFYKGIQKTTLIDRKLNAPYQTNIVLDLKVQTTYTSPEGTLKTKDQTITGLKDFLINENIVSLVDHTLNNNHKETWHNESGQEIDSGILDRWDFLELATQINDYKNMPPTEQENTYNHMVNQVSGEDPHAINCARSFFSYLRQDGTKEFNLLILVHHFNESYKKHTGFLPNWASRLEEVLKSQKTISKETTSIEDGLYEHEERTAGILKSVNNFNAHQDEKDKIKIINMSVGTSWGPKDIKILGKELKNFLKQKGIIVKAAGNSSVNWDYHQKVGLELKGNDHIESKLDTITFIRRLKEAPWMRKAFLFVGSLGYFGNLSPYSDYSTSDFEDRFIYVRGDKIPTLYDYEKDNLPYNKDTPILTSGTSSAAPIVTGTIALLQQAFPEFNPSELAEAILDGADQLLEEGKWIRILNAEKAYHILKAKKMKYLTPKKTNHTY